MESCLEHNNNRPTAAITKALYLERFTRETDSDGEITSQLRNLALKVHLFVFVRLLFSDLSTCFEATSKSERASEKLSSESSGVVGWGENVKCWITLIWISNSPLLEADVVVVVCRTLVLSSSVRHYFQADLFKFGARVMFPMIAKRR